MADLQLSKYDLSRDQRAVFDEVLRWSRGGSRLFTFGGLGGTGKTTVLGVLATAFERRGLLVAYCTLTGRAASILERKLRAAGAATTLKQRPGPKSESSHPELYDSSLGWQDGPAFVGTFHRLVYRPLINNEEEVIGWRRREEPDRKYDLITIDEASMISPEMLLELQSFDIPILAVGDHGQLPPVASSGSIIENPMARLEKIHRQAEGNPIIRLAQAVRERGALLEKYADGDRVRFVEKGKLNEELAVFSDSDTPNSLRAALTSLQVGTVCYTNRVRVWLNGKIRKAAGFSGKPRAGEVLLCLKNNPPVFNGMRGRLTADSEEGGDPAKPWLLEASVEFPEEGLAAEARILCAPQFNRDKTFARVEDLQERGINVQKMSDAGELFDFGYALTCHKAQGSEFALGLVYLDIEERPRDEEWRRWCYTAVTRSKERLVVFV